MVNTYKQKFTQKIPVTVFWNSSRKNPAPFIVINHGRSSDANERRALERARFPGNARHFVSRGFVVLIPTRMGYGAEGVHDVENPDACSSRADIESAFDAGTQQTTAVIELAKTLKQVDSTRGVLLGQSFGGAITIATLSKNIPGIMAGINFAGGGGGDPKIRPENPCGHHLVEKAFEKYGATTKVASLWVYSENDRYWGKKIPIDWFGAFNRNSKIGRFVHLPPMSASKGPDGHATFSLDANTWRPIVDDFLKEVGF